MKLLYPDFIYALSFLVIPIIIHLFNFRRYKTVRFSQVRFLKSIKQETQSTSKLKHFLILLARLFTITSLVLAFCQPYIPNEDNKIKEGKTGVTIYIDNSFSMQLQNEEGSNLNVAKQKAQAVINAYKETDKFRILSNDFRSSHNRWLNKDEFLIELQNIDFSPKFKTISQVINRMNQDFSNEDFHHKIYYLISDLQKNQFKLEQIKDSASIQVIPVSGKVEKNYSLSNVSFNQPYHLKGQEEFLNYSIQNQFLTPEEKVPLKLYLNNILKSPKYIEITNEDSVSGEIVYRSSSEMAIRGKLAIKDFPITYDDTLYFNYSIQNSINVIHIFDKEPNKNLNVLFGSDSIFNYYTQDIAKLDYALLNPPALVILEELEKVSSGLQSALVDYVNKGGSLVLFPSNQFPVKQFSFLLNSLGVGSAIEYKKGEMSVSNINNRSKLFEAVFEKTEEKINLPAIKSKWNFNFNTKSRLENILSFSDNSPFLAKADIGKGRFYLSSIGLSNEESNLVNHAIFVPLMFNMALRSSQREVPFYTLDKASIRIPISRLDQSNESPVHIVGNGQDVIPPQRFSSGELLIELNDQLNKAGHYDLMQENKQIASLSFNYSRKESELEFYSPDELEKMAKVFGHQVNIINQSTEVLSNTISQIEDGTSLWKYFIILALIFIGLEILLLRML